MKAGSDAESSGEEEDEEKDIKSGNTDDESEKDADMVTIKQEEDEVGFLNNFCL